MEILKQKAHEILVENNLDFNISKRPLVSIVDEKTIETPYFGLFNDKSGNCINTVKSGYRVTQNQEVIETVLLGIDKFGDRLSVQKAGSINDGRKVYVQLAIEGEDNVNGDTIKRYITVIDSNDGSTGLSIGIGNLTMSCQNQFFKFYKKGFKMQHSASIEQKISEIPFMVESALSQSIKQVEEFQTLSQMLIAEDMVHKMVKEVIGIDNGGFTSVTDLSKASTRLTNKMDKLYESIDSQIVQKGRTAWGLLSGLTHYTTHINSVPKRENGMLESQMFGTGYDLVENGLVFLHKELELV